MSGPAVAETRKALETWLGELADGLADLEPRWQRSEHISDPGGTANSLSTVIVRAGDTVRAARAHLAAERSEAVGAVERVRAAMLAIGSHRYQTAMDFASDVLNILDEELDRLREGTA